MANEHLSSEPRTTQETNGNREDRACGQNNREHVTTTRRYNANSSVDSQLLLQAIGERLQDFAHFVHPVIALLRRAGDEHVARCVRTGARGGQRRARAA